MPKPKRSASCHPNKQNYAKDLCITCYNLNYRKANRLKFRQYSKEARQQPEYRAMQNAWLKANRHKQSYKDMKNSYNKKRTQCDPTYKLSRNLRTRLNSAIRKHLKTGSAVKDLGCTIEFLKSYLESLWQPGMSWDNYGKYGWHIDHIKPLASFDLTDREELLKACHYTNLQPLWAVDNLKKSDKVGDVEWQSKENETNKKRSEALYVSSRQKTVT
jgi:hypothetical protein